MFWSKRIRTFECRYQKPMPCHLAILHLKNAERVTQIFQNLWLMKKMRIHYDLFDEEFIFMKKISGKMAEWFKATDCKSVDSFHRRFEPYSSQKW